MFNKKIINDINAKFKVTFHSCKPTVNEELDNSFDRTNLEIACLITKHKKVYFTSKTEILKKLDPTLQKLILKLKRIDYFQYYLSKPTKVGQQIIMVPHYDRESRVILYNSTGARNAFLLFLRDTEQNLNEFHNPGSWAESDNHYLTGLLLYYPKKDILFFYKIAAFKEYLITSQTGKNRNQKFKITEKDAFASWPENIKQEFYDFLNQTWLKSDTYKIYRKDQKEANNWIKKFQKISLKKIKLIIQGLEDEITTLNKSYLLKNKPPL